MTSYETRASFNDAPVPFLRLAKRERQLESKSAMNNASSIL